VKATLLLADAVTAHEDGTFTVLRGGINLTTGQGQGPFLFNGGMLVRLIFAKTELGRHDVMVTCVNDKGEACTDHFSRSVVVTEQRRVFSLCVAIMMAIPQVGRYKFVLSVDGRPVEEWPLEARSVGAKVGLEVTK